MKTITKEFRPVINIPSIANPRYMVSVFKTNVSSKNEADAILRLLNKRFPDGKFNFDLEDIDNVFRIEYRRDITQDVIQLFKGKRFICETLI